MRKLTTLLAICCLGISANATGNISDSMLMPSSEQLLDSGRYYFEQRQAGKAMECFKTVSKRHQHDSDATGIRLRIRALNNCACVYKYFHNDHLKAYDYLTQAYRLCDSLHYDEFMPVIMVNMGDLINDNSGSSQAITQQAHEIFDQCMQRAVDTKNWELMTTAFFNLSNQNYDLPLEKYKILFDKEIPDSTSDLKYARLQYTALKHIQQQRYAEARNCFEQQLAAISARWEPVRDSIATYVNIAYTYRKEDDYIHEIDYLNRALGVADDSNVEDQAAYVSQLLNSANVRMLAERQRLQQYVLLGIGAVLLIVLVFSLLLLHKNRQLHNRNKSLYEKNQQLLTVEQEAKELRKGNEEKYRRSNLSDDQRTTLIIRIEEILSSPQVICEQDFTLAKLAKLVDSNTTYVSQVINEKYNTSFSNVLSGSRIKEACRHMNDNTERYSQMTIEAIAAEIGFKSRTAFINAFKREVGLTPSEYIHMAQAEKKS